MARQSDTANGFRRVTAQQLDEVPLPELGPMIFEGPGAQGYEHTRSVRDNGDAFEPDFELDTQEHTEWVTAAIANFERRGPDDG